MKRNIILFTALAGTLYFSLTSYSTGPASGGAGHVAATGCGNGCHGTSANTNTHAMISIARKSDNQPVTDGKYTPGIDYLITIMGHNGSLNKYGYQFSATKGGANAGTLSNPPSGSKQAMAAGINVIEHSGVITGGASGFSVSFDWKAPATGTGNVTLNLAVNAVNGNSQTNGDAYNTAVMALSEATTSVNDIEAAQLKIYPNPATDRLTINLGERSGDYTLYVVDATGRTVYQSEVKNVKQTTLNTSSFASGLYRINIINGTTSESIAFVKQ